MEAQKDLEKLALTLAAIGLGIYFLPTILKKTLQGGANLLTDATNSAGVAIGDALYDWTHPQDNTPVPSNATDAQIAITQHPADFHISSVQNAVTQLEQKGIFPSDKRVQNVMPFILQYPNFFSASQVTAAQQYNMGNMPWFM